MLCPEPGFWGTALCLMRESGWLAADVCSFAASKTLDATSHAAGQLGAASESLPEPWQTWAAELQLLVDSESLRGSKAQVAQVAQAAQHFAHGAIVQCASAADFAAAIAAESAAAALATARAIPAIQARLDLFEEQRKRFAEASRVDLPDLQSLLAAMAWLLSICYGLSFVRCPRRPSEALFFPDPKGGNVARIRKEIGNARRKVWLAMFTLTDDILSNALLDAHRRGVDVRIILDDEQDLCLGADGQRLAAAGVPVVRDNTRARMHHKFAILDGQVLTGSFNWTKQASMANCENLCMLRDAELLKAFNNEFKCLWLQFHRGRPVGPTVRRTRDRTPPIHVRA